MEDILIWALKFELKWENGKVEKGTQMWCPRARWGQGDVRTKS